MAEKRSPSEVLKDLEALTGTRGYMHVIAEIASRDLFLNPREAATINWRERITYQELTLLLGLAIKSAPLSYDELSLDETNKLVEVTRALLVELHWSYNSQFVKTMNDMAQADGGVEALPTLSDEQKDKHFKDVFGSSASMIEATFYDDSGSYDFQYLEMAPRLYQYDMAWLSNTGLDFEKSTYIYKGIKNLVQSMHYAATHPKLVREIAGDEKFRAMDEFAFPKHLLLQEADKEAKKSGSGVSGEDLDHFLKLFSSKPEDQYPDFTGPGDLNIVNIRPIIEIADEVYMIPVSFNLAEAIYQSPAYWMKLDANYLENAAKHRGQATEQITYEYFQGIFGDQAYKSIKIVKGKNTLTDIDVMGVVGSVAVVVQNKGKRMTIDALKGNEEILKRDFKKAIQAAYDQGIQSRDVILGQAGYKFLDEDGNQIVLPQGIEEVYILCVTSDVYPAAMHQLSVYLDKDKGQPWPLAISLFDLDIIATYLNDPYDFAFYIKQRSELTEIAKASGEMAYLGYHLRHGLFKPDNADMFLVDQEFAQLIDADYMHRKGYLPPPSKKHSLVSSWNNPDYDNLLDELRTYIDDPKLTDIIFYLKTIPPNVLDGITQVMHRVRNKAAADGLPHNFSIPITDDGKPWGGFSYVLGRNLKEMQDRLNYIVRVNKYKHRSDNWLGVGVLIGEKQLSNAVLLGQDPWQQSQEMDELVKHHDTNSKGYELSLEALKKERKHIDRSRVNQSDTKNRAKRSKTKRKAQRQARKRGMRTNKRK